MNYIINSLNKFADKRNLEDLTNVPLLSINNDTIQKHIDKLKNINGTRILFGGDTIFGIVHEKYGFIEPTLIYIPLKEIMKKENFDIVTTEIFGPVQIITDYSEIDDVIDCINRIKHKLTAGIVSDNQRFIDYVTGKTTNGTTYTGMNARTTGAPQNHWFGPGGDPRGGSLGTPEAIRHVWAYHRVVTSDIGEYK